MRLRPNLFLFLTASFCSLFCSFFCNLAFACGEALPDEDFEAAFSQAKYVVLASAESITQIQKHRFKDTHDLVENINFRVILSFKGDKATGDFLNSHTDLEFGCTASALNNPIWLESSPVAVVPLRVNEKVVHGPALSGVWLVMVDTDPFLLYPGPSQPIESLSGTDWLRLFRLSHVKNQ